MKSGSLALLLLAFASSAGPALAVEYPAPNGQATAVITDTSATDCEFALEIPSADGSIAVRKDYRSEDHEHGECLGMTQWTPDSRFFVFSLENAGGHQSWRTPIEAYSVETRRMIELEKFLPDPITASGFRLFPPDEIEVETTKLPHDFAHERPNPVIRRLSLGTLAERQ